MFIAREAELKFLNDCYENPKAQLVVLYGRRRIGKTETLHKFCQNKPHIFFSCTQSTNKKQLARFSDALLKENVPARQYVTGFSDWEKAFETIADLPYGEHKKLVIIDEFPYMCEADRSIPSVLQNLWDSRLKNENVMIVLCGSSMSFIEKEILSKKNPLYGRSTGIYKMEEMGFYDAMKFFPDYSDKDKIITYSILGGIPHYLSQWDPNISVKENIKKNILTKGCVLYSEVDFLLHEELRETAIYSAIIDAIALGSTRLNEISQKSLIDDKSKTSVYLKNLNNLGIVSRELSVDSKTKEKGNQGRGTYVLSDNFFRFWYTYGFANYSQLEDGDIDGVYEYSIEPTLNDFASYAFEDVCRQFIRRMQMEKKLPFRFSKIGRWWGKTTVRDTSVPGGLRTAETEIDILAISSDLKKYLAGECKFKKTPFSYSDYLDLTAKLDNQKKSAEFYYALFSASGFDEKTVKAADAENVALYDLPQIVIPD
ncbi:MAG: ATP-binding protein [Clostridia bacterium]|nr:ATP-binding protein [Clostridia bacterium]